MREACSRSERAEHSPRHVVTASALCWALLSWSAPLVLAAGSGTTSAEFLKLSVGAGAAGLGDAYGASARGAEALFWNVAGMAPLNDRAQLAMTHAPLYGLLRHDSLALAFPVIGRKASVGLGLRRLSQPPLEGYDNKGEATGGFEASDQAFSLGVAAPIGSMSVGLGVQAVQSRIASRSATTALADIGLLKTGRRMDIGLALRNLGPGLKFGEERGPAPSSVQLAGRIKLLGALSVAVQTDYGVADRRPRFGLGTEYTLAGLSGASLKLRGGARPEQALSSVPGLLRGGVGLELRRLGVDYAFLPDSVLGSSHRFSVAVRW